MLAKNKRLNLRTNFSWITKGQKTETKYFKVFFRTGENTHPLVGVAIKSSVFKKAHERNLAKRIAFTVLGSIYDKLPNAQNLVIMPKERLDEVSVDALTKEVDAIKALYQLN